MEAEISAEYDEDDKPYQTEGDGEIATYESGSQDNGNYCGDFIQRIRFFSWFCVAVKPIPNPLTRFFAIDLLKSLNSFSFQQAKLMTILTNQN